MSKSLIYILLRWTILLLLFLYCTSEPEFQYTGPEEILPNVLNLELTFGSDEEKLPEEFLLARPTSFLETIAVNEAGDIYVADECYVKVYDSSGNPKKLIGGRGEGPGYFSPEAAFLTLSPSGYLFVGNGFMGSASRANIYGPDDVFIRSIRLPELGPTSVLFRILKKDDMIPQQVMKFISLDPYEMVYNVLAAHPMRVDKRKDYNILIYENADTMFVINKFIQKGNIYYEGGGQGSPSWGDLHWDLLPGRRIIYINTGPYNKSEQKEPNYCLHILSLDTFEETKINQPYLPVEIPAADRNFDLSTITSPERRKRAKIVSKTLNEWKYLASIHKLLVDVNYVFTFTHVKNEAGELLVDIFDMEKVKYLKSAYFSKMPDVIKNGYAYRIKSGPDIFPEIEKYRIDPIVYKK